MEDEEMKEILREAFGDSSSDSDGELSDDRRRRVQANNRIWEPVAGISGLWICRDFLTAEQQSSLLSAIEEEGYLADASRNQ
ncbi:2-oxoglutarate (2OG) and Fe(II)-dependent oxygenase superfamily protein, partial [Striga hermonthica]